MRDNVLYYLYYQTLETWGSLIRDHVQLKAFRVERIRNFSIIGKRVREKISFNTNDESTFKNSDAPLRQQSLESLFGVNTGLSLCGIKFRFVFLLEGGQILTE
jgi:hypothetical protein